jgi:hypothetical protein
MTRKSKLVQKQDRLGSIFTNLQIKLFFHQNIRVSTWFFSAILDASMTCIILNTNAVKEKYK